MSTYLENAIVELTVRGGSYSATTVYVALFTDAANLTELEAGILTNEVTSTSSAYIRKLATFTIPVDGAADNTVEIAFPEATAIWGNIRYAAIIDNDDAVGVTGNILYFGQLTDDKQINSTDVFRFNLGDLNITVN